MKLWRWCKVCLKGEGKNSNKFPFTAGQISGILEEMHTTLSPLTHHWIRDERRLEPQHRRLIYFRVDFNPILFLWLNTQSKLMQEHPSSAGRMLWTKDKDITDRIQICAEKFQGEHIFLFKSGAAKWNDQFRIFFCMWNYSFDWFPVTEMNVFHSIKLIGSLGSTPSLGINTSIS